MEDLAGIVIGRHGNAIRDVSVENLLLYSSLSHIFFFSS
jgi:hypothetical protein